MKVFLVAFSLLFSVNAFSANVYLDTNGLGWDADYYGGIAGGGYSCDENSCSGNQNETFSYLFQSDDSLPAANDDYFYVDTGELSEFGDSIYKGLFREFLSGNSFIALQDFDFSVTYNSFGLENLRLYAGDKYDLASPSGSFIGSALAGQSFSIGMFGLLSDASFADDAFLYYKVTFNPESISEVPLPAGIFLFAPALLGFMGLRRKAKSS